MSFPLNRLLLIALSSVLIGCNRGSVETYESGFSDSVRAEFDLGTGRVDHEEIDKLLRTKRIGYIDGTMWSGISHGADYTELRVDLETLNIENLIAELKSEKLIEGDPTWIVNGVEIKIANKGRQATASPSPAT